MSHDITVLEDGTAEAAFALKPAWHSLGQTIPHAMTSEEAMHFAHLGWSVELQPVSRTLPNGSIEEIDNYKFVVRSDTNDVLSCVSPDYVPIQNFEGFKVLDTLVMDGILKYEAAFSLSGGKDVCLLARMPDFDDEVAEGDTQHRYISCMLNHTGRHNVKFFPTSVRTVCANTKAVALALAKGNKIFKVRHSGDTQMKLSEVRDGLATINHNFDQYIGLARRMAETKLDNWTWSKVKARLVPVPQVLTKDGQKNPDYSDRKYQNAVNIHQDLDDNFFRDHRQTMPSIKGTLWAGYNAVSQMVDHRSYRGRDTQARSEAAFKATQFGVGADLKDKAFEMLSSDLLLQTN